MKSSNVKNLATQKLAPQNYESNAFMRRRHLPAAPPGGSPQSAPWRRRILPWLLAGISITATGQAQTRGLLWPAIGQSPPKMDVPGSESALSLGKYPGSYLKGLGQLQTETITIGQDEFSVGGGGVIVGNGGDPLRRVVWEMKAKAADLVRRADENELAKLVTLDASVIAWLKEHRLALADDILATPHVWLEPQANQQEDGQDSCARTLLEAKAAIRFDYALCRRALSGALEIVALLIHESVHHFGIPDDDRSIPDLFANLFVRSLTTGSIHWRQLAAPIAPMEYSAITEQNGRIVVFGGKDADGQDSNLLQAYDPATKQWTRHPISGLPKRFAAQLFALDAQRLLLWGGATEDTDTGDLWFHADGFIIDLASASVQTIPSPFPGDNRIFPRPGILSAQTAVWTGKQLIVWGHPSLDRPSLHGARFDLSTKKWLSISHQGSPKVWGAQVAAWTGTHMLVWGGVDAQSRVQRTGAAYDPVSDRWRAMTSSGSPEQAAAGTAVWTGRHLITFGGRSSQQEAVGQFGIYDFEADRWKAVNSEIVPARENHILLWTGTQALVLGGAMRRTNTTFDTPIQLNPETLEIQPTSPVGGIGPLKNHAAVWAQGAAFIIGGRRDVANLNPAFFELIP